VAAFFAADFAETAAFFAFNGAVVFFAADFAETTVFFAALRPDATARFTAGFATVTADKSASIISAFL
jgi:hypothetical protein